MSIQFQHALPGKEFRPTEKGISDYWMDKRFSTTPRYKTRVPKNWLAKGWVKEVRTSWVK